MKNLSHYSLFFATTFTCAINSMNHALQPHQKIQLPPYTYEPWRRSESYISAAPKEVGVEKIGERLGTCGIFAITADLGIFGQAPTLLKLSQPVHLITACNIMQYYKQVEQPTTGNLAVYTDENGIINHFSTVIDSDINIQNQKYLMVSKFALDSRIFKHNVFDTPYGRTVAFYTRKNRPLQTNKFLLFFLQKSIAESPVIKKELRNVQRTLLQAANGYHITSHNPCFSSLSTVFQGCYLLKGYMGLDINTHDNENNTILMLATKRNDVSMMSLFLSMGADKYLRNNDGMTALDIAEQLGYDDAINLLK